MSSRLRPLTGEASKIWKLLTRNDLASLQHGLELASALDRPLEGVLDGVCVDARGELLRSSRFSGTAAEQPVLDAVLLHQLSMATDESHEAVIRRSVRRLALALPLVPTLRGFDGLEHLELTLHGEEECFASLDALGPLPSLTRLVLKVSGEGSTLRSLAGLRAAQLEQADLAHLGLQEVSALQDSRHLRIVDLSGNPNLASLNGLESARATLQTLRVGGCAGLADIEALRGCAMLEWLNLESCSSLTSLKALGDSTRLTRVVLKECASLSSLEGLAAQELQPMKAQASAWSPGFSLRGCRSLPSLKGLPLLSESFGTLDLQDMRGLVSLSGIEAARHQADIQLSHAPVTDLAPLTTMSALEGVTLRNLPNVVDVEPLGSLPALQSVVLDECPRITSLPSQWAGPLQKLSVHSLQTLASLGKLPSSLEILSLHDTPLVSNLEGLEAARALKELNCGDSVSDATAIATHPLLTVSCHLQHGNPQPAQVVSAFGTLPSVRLGLSGIQGADLRWLVDLPGLCKVFLYEDSAEANGLEQTIYETQSEVHKLQRKICRSYKLPLPPHLKPVRAGTKPASGAPQLKDLKGLLTSDDPAQVSEGLRLMKEAGDPALYDQVVDGIDPITAYNGDSRAMGRLFREVKADGRLLARWALTHLLAAAPELSTQAVAARRRIGEITLVELRHHVNHWGSPPAPKAPAFQGLTMPALDGFTGLEKLTLQGLAIPDLEWLGKVPSLRHLILKDLPGLTSFRGLSGVPGVETMRIDDCLELKDLSDLRHLGRLGAGGPLYQLYLREMGPLRDLGFVAGLSCLHGIRLRLAARADLSGFADAASIRDVFLELDSWDVDLSPLRHVRKLHVSQASDPEDESEHRWSYPWPAMEALYISNGRHRFADLHAPSLQSVSLYGMAASLQGLGAITRLEGSLRGVGSIEALVDSQVAELNLSGFKGRFEPVSRIQSLKRITLPSALSPEQVEALRPCRQIVTLNAQRYSGSLSFLKNWESLSTLDLRDSGDLADLDVLLQLPKLSRIRLKGAKMKRESWPAALQERMNYRD